MKQSSLAVLNYCIACIAALGIILSWVRYLESKHVMRNPLIPERLADIYFKPALLYTAVFAVVIVLQLLSARFKKGRYVAAVFGVIAIAAGGVFYPYVAGWFL